jgi:hypothetical protein
MDEIRRALVLGLPALGALGLVGCGDGSPAGVEVSSLGANEQAFAVGLSGNSALTVASANSAPLSEYFNSQANLGSARFKPDLTLIPACLKGGSTKLALRLHETVVRPDGQCVYRTLALALSSPTTMKSSPRLSLAKPGAVVGKLMVHGDDEAIGATYLASNSGSIRVINPLFTSFFYVQFDKVKLARVDSTEAITLNGTLAVRYLIEDEPYPFG